MMEKKRVPETLKKAIAASALIVGGSVLLTHDGEPKQVSLENSNGENTAPAEQKENPSAVVSHEALSGTTVMPPRTAVYAPDTSTQEKEARVDNMRSDIEREFGNGPAVETKGEAKIDTPAGNTAKIEIPPLKMSIQGLEDAFRTMISDTLEKKNKNTHLDSLVLDDMGDHIEFRATLRSKTWLKTFTIKVTGIIRNEGSSLAVRNSHIKASLGAQGAAEKEILPLLDKLPSDLVHDISGREGKNIDSLVLKDGKINIIFQ